MCPWTCPFALHDPHGRRGYLRCRLPMLGRSPGNRKPHVGGRETGREGGRRRKGREGEERREIFDLYEFIFWSSQAYWGNKIVN